MIITNKNGLPQACVNCVQNERHNEPNSLSATTLIRGACETIIIDKKFDEIETDVEDNMNAIMGTAFHNVMEEHETENVAEQKFSVPVNGINITGKIDAYSAEKKLIIDYKTCASWKIIHKDFDEWYKQGTIYAWLLKQSGIEIKTCRFIAWMKDFSPTEAERNPDYPQSSIYQYEFEVTDESLVEIEQFIKDKVELYLAERNKPLEELTPCSPKERWQSEAVFAVMKKGRQSAINAKSTTRDDAEKIITELKSDPKNAKNEYFIEERPAVDKKCVRYCIARKFCKYWQDNYKEE